MATNKKPKRNPRIVLTEKEQLAKDKLEKRESQRLAVIMFTAGLLLLAIELIPSSGLWLWLKSLLFGMFGLSAVLLPIALIYISILITIDKLEGRAIDKVWQIAVFILLISGLSEVLSDNPYAGANFFEKLIVLYQGGLSYSTGGIFSIVIGGPLLALCGKTGAVIIMLLFLFAFFMILTGSTLLGFLLGVKKSALTLGGLLSILNDNRKAKKSGRIQKEQAEYERLANQEQSKAFTEETKQEESDYMQQHEYEQVEYDNTPVYEDYDSYEEEDEDIDDYQAEYEDEINMQQTNFYEIKDFEKFQEQQTQQYEPLTPLHVQPSPEQPTPLHAQAPNPSQVHTPPTPAPSPQEKQYQMPNNKAHSNNTNSSHSSQHTVEELLELERKRAAKISTNYNDNGGKAFKNIEVLYAVESEEADAEFEKLVKNSELEEVEKSIGITRTVDLSKDAKILELLEVPQSKPNNKATSQELDELEIPFFNSKPAPPSNPIVVEEKPPVVDNKPRPATLEELDELEIPFFGSKPTPPPIFVEEKPPVVENKPRPATLEELDELEIPFFGSKSTPPPIVVEEKPPVVENKPRPATLEELDELEIPFFGSKSTPSPIVVEEKPPVVEDKPRPATLEELDELEIPFFGSKSTPSPIVVEEKPPVVEDKPKPATLEELDELDIPRFNNKPKTNLVAETVDDDYSTKLLEEQEEINVLKKVAEFEQNSKQSQINELDKVVEEKPQPEAKKSNAYEDYMFYDYPPTSLLKRVSKNANSVSHDELKQTGDLLIDTLASFKVQATLLDISRGPSVTRYEIKPATGVKLSKIIGLGDDIALNLSASGVRVAPIPGKPAVGIEVPNLTTDVVTMREIIESDDFDHAESNVSIALGKDITGNSIIGDIATMPHMLIAGSTGSGKSVCINSIIMSILYKSSPEDVRLLMIDPKVVELGIYNGIPHLLVPVVTDPRKAAGALAWAVKEMLKRYESFAENNVRDIKGYNALEGDHITHMPQIVIIIDELADLMMAASKEVEDSICRLAQMARAAGMHLIIATQRPSVDVITGLIKANVPSRIAFAVSSQIDSRTILDSPGAEKLLGKGDMLFSPVGANKHIRVQGCFVSDDEINKVVNFIKAESKADYDEQILKEIEEQAVPEKGSKNDKNSGGGFDSSDELIDEAIEIVVEAGKASTSFLQRKLRIGYARAAKIIDEMEERNLVAPQDGSKPRQVLISKQEWYEMKLRS